MLALAAGEIDVSALSSGAAFQAQQSGTARLLAIDGDKRMAQLPDVPTFAEAGFPQMRAPSWWAIVVRNGTPDAIVKKLNADLNEAIADPTFQDFMTRAAFTPGGGSQADLAALIKDTASLWAPIIEKLQLRRNIN
jgi:tripartite-type tricarboxylate transporter receptor subunit TctC